MQVHPKATEWFLEFWACYFRKVAKLAAYKAFCKAATSEAMKDTILAAVRAQSPLMLSRDVSLRPHAASWLNGRRWEDEVELPTQNPPKPMSANELFLARKRAEALEQVERSRRARQQEEEYRLQNQGGAA